MRDPEEDVHLLMLACCALDRSGVCALKIKILKTGRICCNMCALPCFINDLRFENSLGLS